MTRQKADSELLEMIHSDIKFFTVEEDGSFALKKKSRDEIKMILEKTGNL